MATAEKIDWKAFLDAGSEEPKKGADPRITFKDKGGSGDVPIEGNLGISDIEERQIEALKAGATEEEASLGGRLPAVKRVPVEESPEEETSTGRKKVFSSREEMRAFLSEEPPEGALNKEDLKKFLNEDVEETGTWEQMHYDFDKMPTASENAAIWLESRFPIGRIAGFDEEGEWFWYQSPEDTYGPDFMDLSPEQRRERIVDVRNKSIAEEHADVIAEFGEGGSGVGKVGMVAGALADPTTLIPITKSLKLATAATSALGAIDTALYGLAQEGKIDPGDVAIGATVGAIIPSTLYVAGKGIKTTARGAAAGVRRTTPTGRAEKARAGALNTVFDFEDQLAVNIARGEPPTNAVRNAMESMGIDKTQLEKLVAVSGHKPKIPTPKHAADMAKAKADGGVRGGTKGGPIDTMFGALHTRIKSLNPRIANEVRRHEYNVRVGTHEALTKSHQFLDNLRSFKGEDYRILSKALMNGEHDTVERYMSSKFGAEGTKAFEDVKTLLKDYSHQMAEVGYDSGSIPNYFPRLVKDRKLLLQKMGAKEGTELQKAIDTAKAKAQADGRTLTALEESDVINKFMRGYTPREKKPGFAKKRQITTVTDEMLEAYADPVHSLHSYIRKMTNDIEERKFFGRLGVQKSKKDESLDPIKDRTTLLAESIGEVIRRERDAGGLRPDDELVLESMLSARFQYGNMSPNAWIQDTKNILYAATLSNPVSAATQLGDVGLAMYVNGFRNSMKAMLGAKNIDMRDLGLDDVAQELTTDVRATSRFLDKSLKWGGFKMVDRFGKNTLLNGSLNKHKKLVKSVKGRKEFAQKYRTMFGDELEQVMDDLDTGKMTENVKFLLWNDLSNIQPISLSEVPESYLRNPNGRILYMLKTFTIKQMDIIRSTIAREYKHGSKKQAVKNLVSFTTLFGTANMGADRIKDWMLGRETDVSDAVVFNLWGVIGITEYLAGQVQEGSISEGIKDTVAPPLRVIDDTYKAFATALDSDTEQDFDFVKNFPIIGKVAHNYLLGGLEEHEERQVREQRKKELERAR